MSDHAPPVPPKDPVEGNSAQGQSGDGTRSPSYPVRDTPAWAKLGYQEPPHEETTGPGAANTSSEPPPYSGGPEQGYTQDSKAPIHQQETMNGPPPYSEENVPAQGFVPDQKTHIPHQEPSTRGASSAVESFYPPPTQATSGVQPTGFIPGTDTPPPPSFQGAGSYQQPPGQTDADLYPAPLQIRPNPNQQALGGADNSSFYPPPPPGQPPVSQTHQQADLSNTNSDLYAPPPPPRRIPQTFEGDDISNPIHYTRDPHKLTAYLIPFPKPRVHVKGAALEKIPTRFLIYTPPPPPLSKPAEGVKEDRAHKVQRKWEEEVRKAKTSTAKTASWQGMKSRATKGISWAMSQTKTANLEFLNRIVDDSKSGSKQSPSTSTDTHAEDGVQEGAETKKTVGLEEMVLVYPSSIPGSQEEMRQEFVGSMMRSKSKAQRDAIVATGLIPVSAAIDILATVIWPFGGLLEIDSVWAYSSIRGAKTARSTTKRLTSTSQSQPDANPANAETKEDQLRLTFTPSPRLEVLAKYLAARCHERDANMFASAGVPPTETDVLEAIGWAPSQTGGEEKNWEDEQWEISEVKEDVRDVMRKGAREWGKWCVVFEKDPEKAVRK